jgi:hypothetical protein
MLAEQFIAAAAGARNRTALDETARLLWRAHAEAQIPDAEAEAFQRCIQSSLGMASRSLAAATRAGEPRLSPRAARPGFRRR